jgi:ankyrin repeat protein
MRLPRFAGFEVVAAVLLAAVFLAPMAQGENDGKITRLKSEPPPTVLAPVAEGPEETVATPDSEGEAMVNAALARDWKKVKELLAAGADPKAANDLGMTPLMAAAIAGHVPTIEALVAAGAPLDAVDARVRTALGYAVALKKKEAIEALLARQPVLPSAANGGDDLAASALDSGDPQLLDTILRRLPPGLTWTPAARIAFAKALAAKDTLMGPLLIAKYGGPPAPHEGAQPMLAYAIARGDLDEVRDLLDFGADPNTVLDQPGDKNFREWISSNYVRYYLDSTQGISVLMLAAGMKQTACVKLLLERGANKLASTKGKARLIALYFAAWSDDPETQQALISNAPSKDAIHIEVSIDEQRMRYYRDGRQVLTATVSTGRPGFPTRPGEYVVTDKNRHHTSSIYDDASMPYFMRLSCRDFGLHEGNVGSSFASHGCIRLPGNVARQLFSEVPVGTWVSVRRSSKQTVAADSETTSRKARR